jgi:hypothetical protein
VTCSGYQPTWPGYPLRAIAAGPGRFGRVSLENVIRLLDAHTGTYAEVRPNRAGLLRVCAHVLTATGESDISGLRVLLVADLLTRVAELRKLQVLTVLASGEQRPGWLADLQRAADTLGIHRAAAHAGSDDAEAALDGPIDVHLASHVAGLDDRSSGLVTWVGTAHMSHAGRPGQIAENVLAGPLYEPPAVRLALLSFAYDKNADLTEDVLASARDTARHWRRLVAEWAQSPSRPVPGRIAEGVQAASADLDTVSLLALLHDLTVDDSTPEGARFETFLYADRILGLDLPGDIGRL